MHLMRWQQLFPQIFLCSYPFLIHLKSIFVAGASWKVVQGKMKLTLLTYVRFEEDDPLGPTPLDIYLLYYLLRDLSPCFLLLERIIIKKWDFKPNANAQVLSPHSRTYSLICNMMMWYVRIEGVKFGFYTISLQNLISYTYRYQTKIQN